MERKVEKVEEVFARLFGAPRRADERLAEVVARTIAPARPLVDLKIAPCNWTKENEEDLKRIFVTWGTGASMALDLYVCLVRVGKEDCPPEVWENAVDAINKMLDAIAPLEPVIRACARWVAKYSLLQLGIIRIYDLVDDWNFAAEVRTELARTE